MGDVWKCWDPALQRIVAVKIMTRGVTQQFLREAQLAARLNHPHIVNVYELGWHASSPYLVMKYIDGAPMSRRAVTPAGAIEIMSRVCDAVDFAHRQGVLHGDLKPANILFDGEPRITDFGLSRVIEDRADVRGDLFALGETLRALIPEPNRHASRVIRRATHRGYSRAADMAEDLRSRPRAWAGAAAACLAWLLLPPADPEPVRISGPIVQVESDAR